MSTPPGPESRDTLSHWLAWMETLHPTRIDLGLERISAVYEAMDLHIRFPAVITVAGTNGKGSSIAMLEAIYLGGSYRTASYTSPHLLRYNERVRVNGKEVDDAALCSAFRYVDQARGVTTLTYFEFGTLAALYLFARQAPDVVLLEVGMGGRLDAVNIVDADIALITSICLDHVDWLGVSREHIGREKAGILRHGHPAVCGDPEPPESLVRRAQQLEAPLHIQGRDFRYESSGDHWNWFGPGTLRTALPPPSLAGDFQFLNAAAVLMVVSCLKDRLPVADEAVRNGLAGVSLQGRMQVIPGVVEQIMDVAHNPHAARALANELRGRPHSGRTHAVMGIMADKDIPGVAQAMVDVVDDWHVATLGSERGADADAIARCVRSADDNALITVHDSVRAARSTALEQASAGDRIVIFGSFQTVAEVMQQGV